MSRRNPKECVIGGCNRPPSWDARGAWFCHQHCPEHAKDERLALVRASFDPGLTDHGALVLHWPIGAPRDVAFEFDPGHGALRHRYRMNFEHSAHEARLYIALPRGSQKPERIHIDRATFEFTRRAPPNIGSGFYLRESEATARERHARMRHIAEMHQRHAPEPPRIDADAELDRLGAALGGIIES